MDHKTDPALTAKSQDRWVQQLPHSWKPGDVVRVKHSRIMCGHYRVASPTHYLE